jgi:hypothetical protein
MLCLTVGPSLNLICCVTLRQQSDPFLLFNRRWFSSEILELIGISILDVSLIEMEEHFVLIAEVVGFLTLCLSAGTDFDYAVGKTLPSIGLRLDLVHSSECLGLIVLIAVACIQFRIKSLKHEHERHSQHEPKPALPLSVETPLARIMQV